MIIKIERKKPKGEFLDGILSIDGTYTCDTTENAHSCIPEGIFTIKRWKCKQKVQNRYIPVVMMNDGNPLCRRCRKLKDVNYDTAMPCCCPQITVGNGTRNLHDGRILIGQRFLDGIVEHSLETYKLFSERIRKHVTRGRTITLIIKNIES